MMVGLVAERDAKAGNAIQTGAQAGAERGRSQHGAERLALHLRSAKQCDERTHRESPLRFGADGHSS